MFDLNAIVSAAISAAITEATKPLLERITTLESANDILHRTQHEDMVAMRDRIAALEGDVSHKVQVQQANITAALAERIATLESDLARAVSVVEQRTERITALETKLTEANLFTQMVPTPSVLAAQYTPISNEQIKAALQEWVTTGGFVTRDEVEALIEQSMDHHLECYDHDNYDEMASKVDDLPELDDYVTRDEVRSEIEDVLNNATLSLSI